MEDSRDSTNTPSSSGAHLVKRGRAKNVVDDYGVNNDNDCAEGCTDHYTCNRTSIPYYDLDTAPFDVAAFLDYLAALDNCDDTSADYFDSIVPARDFYI